MDITAGKVKELREKTGLGMMTCKKALTDAGGDMEKAIEDLRKQGETTAAKRAGKAAKEGKIAVTSDTKQAIVYEVNCETDFVARNEDFLAFFEALGGELLSQSPADVQSAMAMKSELFQGQNVEGKITELMGKIGEKITFRRFQGIQYNPENEGVFSYIHGNGKIGVLVKVAAETPEAIKSQAVADLGKDLAMQVAASNPIAVDRDSVPSDMVEKEREIYKTQAENSGKPEKIWDKIVDGKLNKYFAEICLVEQIFIKNTDQKVSDRVAEAAKAAGSGLKVVSFVRYELGSDEEEEE